MIDCEQIDPIIKQHGFGDYKWLVPRKDIFVEQWVRFRCMFGCNEYGKLGCCPPAVPSVEECRNMIYECENAIIIHFPSQADNRDDIKKSMARLALLERDIFLAGYYKAFLLQFNTCKICEDCTAEGARVKCINKAMSRPTSESMAIDVYKTARKAGFPIQVVKDHDDAVNRYAFLLVD
jgi:predicted metal-binding protein